MDEIQSVIEKTELDFLDKLVIFLRNGTISFEDGKTLTREFLAMTPFTSEEDLQDKIKQFIAVHRNFEGIYITLLNFHEQSKTQELLKRMQEHIKDNKIDEALQLVAKKP